MHDQVVHEAVAEFQEKFDTPKTEEFWESLVVEELNEATEALYALLKEITDIAYVGAGLNNVAGCYRIDEFISYLIETEQVDVSALTVLHSIVGVLPSDSGLKVFERVHASNMSKVQKDGSVKRDPETGKILKPDHYVAPCLVGVFD